MKRRVEVITLVNRDNYDATSDDNTNLFCPCKAFRSQGPAVAWADGSSIYAVPSQVEENKLLLDVS